MKRQMVEFDPQIIQFVTERQQLVKVTNLANSSADNCVFCMFNTQKYKFVPDCFSLQPNEQKLITVHFLGQLPPRQVKQFAYLKSSSFSKRITLINGPSTISQDRFKSPQSGVEELNTLSSREYRDSEVTGLYKIISDKEAYIQRLQRMNEQMRDSSTKKESRDFSESKAKNFYLSEIESLEAKIMAINAEKQKALLENNQLQNMFNQYKEIMSNDTKYKEISDLVVQKDELIKWQKQQRIFHENQSQELLQKISEFQKLLEQAETAKKQQIGQITQKNSANIKKLQQELTKTKENANKASKIYEQRIKQLEQSMLESEADREKLHQLQQQLKSKKKELDRLNKELANEKQSRNRIQELKQKQQEYLNNQHKFKKQNKELVEKIDVLQKSIHEIRQENFIYRSKIEDNDQSTSKVGHYLEVALESCKNQNQILKMSKVELEKQVQEKTRVQKNYENQLQSMQRKIDNLNSEINDVKGDKDQLLEKNRSSKQQMHETIIKLKNQNIDLIEKINVWNQKDTQKVTDLEAELLSKDEAIGRITEQLQKANKENQKLMKRIEKTRKETKRELKSIQDDAVEELRRVKHEKSKLTKKVAELQQSINSQTYDLSRAKTKTHYDATPNTANNNIKTRCPRSQGQRKLGIRNQKKQLEQSRSSSNMPQIDLQGLYSELGHLRQFKNYINNQLQKLGRTLGIQYNKSKQNNPNQENRNFIFSTINFFDEFKEKMNTQRQRNQSSGELEKENYYLKGRIEELEMIYRENKEFRELPSDIEIEKNEEANQSLLQYVRKEMKNQYSKMYDALRLSDDKFGLLKKKIYEEYRARIIGVLSNKNKDDLLINRLQSILERFVEGLGNLSHKEAVLAKQVRLKNSARKQSENLRIKVKHLTQLIQMKKGYCSRQPLIVNLCQNENQLHDMVKLEAKVFSLQSEMAKIKEQLQLSKTNASYIQQQLKLNLTDLKDRQDQVNRLKRQIIKLQKQNERELTRRQEQLDSMQKKYFDNNQSNNRRKSTVKQSEYNTMKEELQRKKEIIRNLKDREKMLEQLLESTQRNQSEIREKSKRDILEQQRKQTALRQFKDANRELRTQNRSMKEQINQLLQELQGKNSLLKRMKNEGEEHRIRTLKVDETTNEKLKSQVEHLKEELFKSKENYEKLKKKKEKEVQELQSDLKRKHNEALIQQRSYQSIIRALVDTMRRVYMGLDIILRKKGKRMDINPDFDELMQSPDKIDSLKVYESFEQALETLKDQ